MTSDTASLGTPLDAAFIAALRQLFEDSIPFNRVIGLRIDAVGAERSLGHLRVRPELIGHPLHQRLHGGVIGSALDAMAGVALLAAVGDRHRDEDVAARMGRFARFGTIDMRIDYLRPAIGERVELQGEVLRLGSRIASARMGCSDAEGRLLATGSATYIVS